MPRLLLINPSNKQKGLGNIKATAWPPLNLPYIAALTPAHYDIRLIDENIEPFTESSADLVGITAYTSSVSRGYEIAQIYRSKGVPVVMGGIHVSMLPDEALDYCTTVVIGEAESVWPQVLRDFEAGEMKPKYRGQWLGLAQLPIPRRDLLKNSHYRWGSLQTSRGCPMNCDFCSVTAFNGNRFRRRPLKHVIEELQRIPQRFVLLVDDNIVGYGRKDAQWAKQFFSEIIRRRIKKIFFAQVSLNFGEDPELVKLARRAGLRVVLVGMESINPGSLASMNKKLNLKRLQQDRYRQLIQTIRRGGIAFLGAFMLGNDADTPAVFTATLRFIRQTGIDILQLTKPTPLPGTRFWDQLERDQRIKDKHFPDDWKEYRLTKLVYEPENMTREDVYAGFTHLREAYYSRGETIRRTLRTLRDTRSPTATLLAYKFNASYRKAFYQSEHFKCYHRRRRGA
ncbi:MAG: radical SAM protein [Desulfobacterales bacterium]|nr:radical SAM protein [Desulfobacterales bacterium]